MMTRDFGAGLFRNALVVACLWADVLGAEPPKTPPDLTQDSKVDRELTYNLGATGLRGWIFTRAANYFESQQGRTTTASRQILVTHVGEHSPAAGIMQVDDVILGVDGKRFSDDARKSFAQAIQDAETKSRGGILKLTRWRSGKSEEVGSGSPQRPQRTHGSQSRAAHTQQ